MRTTHIESLSIMPPSHKNNNSSSVCTAQSSGTKQNCDISETFLLKIVVPFMLKIELYLTQYMNDAGHKRRTNTAIRKLLCKTLSGTIGIILLSGILYIC